VNPTTAPTQGLPGTRTRVRPVLFRHPVNALLPAAVRAIIQDGMLEGVFENALVPDFLFPAYADLEPIEGAKGQRVIRTRTGLLTPQTTPLFADPTPEQFSIEQWSATLDQYGHTMDTNMLANATSFARKFVQDVQTLGINAGQSLNRLARTRLFSAYAGGRTWVRTVDGASNVSVDVQSVDGFEFVIVNGVPTAVSGSNPLSITINGVANTVVGVNRTTRVLTLGTATTDTVGHAVVAANAPVSIRPNARASAFNITTGDVATVGLFFDAVARLRAMNVPTMEDGTYHAHVDSFTMRQLLSDTEFRQAFQSQGPSEDYRSGRLTIFGGVTFILNMETPTVTGDGQAATVRRPIVLGGGSLISTPLEGQGQLLDGTGVEDVPGISMIELPGGLEVPLIVRPPQDRFQQVVSTTWSWTGDFAVPTDSTSGDSAIVKRAVVIEHL
jgi:hypothetical protein